MPRRYAILVGSSRYPKDSTLRDLRCPERDVEGLRRALESAAVGFEEVQVLKDVPHYEVQRQINGTLKKAGKDEFVFIYFSGHGKLDAANRLHLCCVDTETGSLEATAVPVENIKNYIDVAATRQVALVLDCCFSGAVGGVFAKSGVDDQLQQVSGGRGVYVVAASTSTQVAIEKDDDENSVFTKHFIKGLESGAADVNGDGLITMDEIYEYVHDNVLDEGSQEPMKWGVNVRGQMVLARTGKSPRAEKRKLIRKKLLELAGQNVLPDRILADAMRHLALPADQASEPHDELLENLGADKIGVGDFIDGWFGLVQTAPPVIRVVPTPPDPPKPEPSAPVQTFSQPVDSKPVDVQSPPPPGPGEVKPKPPETWQERPPIGGETPPKWPTGHVGPSRKVKLAAAAGVGVVSLVTIAMWGWPDPEPTFDDEFVSTSSAPYFIDFEDGFTPISFSGNWFVDASRVNAGSYSLRSSSIGDNSQTDFQLTAPYDAKTVNFSYLISAENVDVLEVYVNGALMETLRDDDTGMWRYATYSLSGTGGDQVRWSYKKDGSLAQDADAAWVDDISFNSTAGGTTSAEPYVNFETGSFPASFQSGTWFIDQTRANDGFYSAASPDIGDNETASFELLAPANATGVSFNYFMSTENTFDDLNVYLNGQLLQTLEDDDSGIWRFSSLTFTPSASNVVRWEFYKDGSESSDEDRVWVDTIEFAVTY